MATNNGFGISSEESIRLIIKTCLANNVTNPDQIAYVLATARHESGDFKLSEETNGRAQAIKLGYFGGAEYFGRGYVQITHDDNYKKFDRLLGLGGKLTSNLNLAKDPEIAAKIMVLGMRDGLFRSGNKMDRFINDQETDFYKARLTVNGVTTKKPDTIRAAKIIKLHTEELQAQMPNLIDHAKNNLPLVFEKSWSDITHGISKPSAAEITVAIETRLAKLKTEKTDLTADINVVKGQKKVILELGEHLKNHSFDNLKDVQKLDALAKTAKIELVTPAEAILADKKTINYTNKADVTALQNVLFERGLITSPSRGIFGAQTKNALIKEFDLPQNHIFGNELAAEHLEKLNPKTIEAIQEKVDLALSKVQKNLTTLENKMIVIDQSITALEAKRVALNDPTIENQQALRVAEVESPDLAQLQDDLVLKEMFIAELEQRIANLTALTAQVPDQQIENIEKIEKPDLKIDLLEVENKEILLTMTATGMSFNINGKDHDASYFNQHQVGITDTQSTYRNETNTLLAKYEYESDQFSIFHKNPYTVDKIAVISDFSQQNTINLVSFDAVKTQSLEKQKSLGKSVKFLSN